MVIDTGPTEWEISGRKGMGTLAFARPTAVTHPRGHRSGSEHCDRGPHGLMERADSDDLAAFEFEKNGATYRFKDRVGFHYCPFCIDEKLREPGADTSDRELLEEVIPEEWTHTFRPGIMEPKLFDLVSVDWEAVMPKYCPACGSQVEAVADGVVECRYHGVVGIELTPLDEDEADTDTEEEAAPSP